jgi:hypothetical protein
VSVAFAQRLLSKRGLDPAGERITDPNDRAEQADAKDKLKGGNHRFVSVIFLYAQHIKRAIKLE